MAVYVVRRLGWALVVLLAIAVVTFFVTYILPADPARMIAGIRATPEDVARIRHALGLDQPFLVQLGSYLARLVQGDFGHSYIQNRAVLGLILERFPATLQLAIAGMLLALAIGLPLGVFAATHRGTWPDRVATTFATVLVAAPSFLVGYLLLNFLAFQPQVLAHVEIFPIGGYRPLDPRYVALPALTLAFAAAAYYTRLTRTTMIDELSKDYLRTARAKGVAERPILWRHAFRNALDPATGDLGVAVQSKFLAVGAVVPWARAGVGAVATQAFANTDYGPAGLRLLAEGSGAQVALGRLVAADDLAAQRQAGIVDASGGSASHTGADCFAWAGGRTGSGFAAQGNILAGPLVVDALAETFLAGGAPFAELLIACLAAADDAGGDRRGRESAALLVVREGGGYGGRNDRLVDLRVDHDDDPIGRLGGLLALQRLYFDRPTAEDLVALEEPTARELRAILTALDAGPGGRFGAVYVPMSGEAAEPEPRPRAGEPRPLPAGWDERWQRALDDWMSVENLEERAAAAGSIDRRVLEMLRARQPG